MVNFHQHVINEFEKARIDNYLVMKGDLDEIDWRTNTPFQFYDKINEYVTLRLN